jgi:FeS assembly SUF system protein
LREEAIKVLKNCYDPEIPVNIYDLGLVYDIQTSEDGGVLVVMTLTSPACPVAGSLPIEIQDKLREHPMINDARVEITFDPPWSFDNMSEEAKYELGFI